MRATIVTPDKAYFDGEASFVVLPAWDGEIGVLPGHAPLIARLSHGVARVTHGDQVTRLALFGGFLKVQDDLVSVLASGAASGEVAPAEAQKALDEAEKHLEGVRAKGREGQAALAEAEERVRRARTVLRLVSSSR